MSKQKTLKLIQTIYMQYINRITLYVPIYKLIILVVILVFTDFFNVLFILKRRRHLRPAWILTEECMFQIIEAV